MYTMFGSSFILTLILITSYNITHAEPHYQYSLCYEDLTYSNNSQFKRNLDSVLAILPTTNTGLGFFTHSTGEGANVANATALCRGGLDSDTCQSCLMDLILTAGELCPNIKGAFFIYDDCILNYFNKDLRRDLHVVFKESQKALDLRVFKTSLMSLFNNLIKVAASGSVLQKFASSNTTAPNSTTIYGLVQCNPDLSGEECTNCLNSALSLFFVSDSDSDEAVGGRVLRPTCNFWYNIKPYYNKSAHIRSPPPSTQGKKNTMIIVIIVTICIIIMIVFINIIFIMRKKKQPKENILELSIPRMKQYDFNLVKLATNGFANDAKLGQGGFGPVYRGNLQGKDIAVKRLQKSSGGEEEFKNEISILGSVVHKNLVRLLGYSLEGSERLLVYEYLPKGSLDKYISDSSKRAQLHWEKKINILTGISNGLVYLHRDSHPQIVHRDMKPGNVLLDDNLEAKIADFGLATMFNQGEIARDTTHIAGTYGYMPPEYAMWGHFSEKTDVYSFGVLMLEIIAGQMRRNQCYSNGETVISYAWRHWRNGTLTNVIDPLMQVGQDASRQISRCINIALLCVQENDADRPTSKEVTTMLENSRDPNSRVPSPISPQTHVPVLASHASSSTTSMYITLSEQLQDNP